MTEPATPVQVLLKHVVQPNKYTCVSACLSMILGEPVDKIVDEFHEDYYANRIDPYAFIRSRGLLCFPRLSIDRTIRKRTINLATVPSKGNPGGFHSIVVYVDADGLFHVLDPMASKGSFYTGDTVQGLIVDVEIYEVDLIAYRTERGQL